MKTQTFDRLLSICLGALFSATALASAQDNQGTSAATPAYRNSNLTIEERVADLLPRLTLEQKVQEISGGWESKIEVDRSDRHVHYGIGTRCLSAAAET